MFTCYIQYVSNSDQQRRTIDRLMKESPEFSKFIEKAKQSEVQNGVDIRSLLIKPLQRFCSYPLLLKPLKEHVPKVSPSFEDMQDCFEKFKFIIQRVEDSMEQLKIWLKNQKKKKKIKKNQNKKQNFFLKMSKKIKNKTKIKKKKN